MFDRVLNTRLFSSLLQDEHCDVAFMPGNTCYTVSCYSEKLCESIPATPSHLALGGVQISHIIRGGGKGDDVDEFRKKNGVNRNSCEWKTFFQYHRRNLS